MTTGTAQESVAHIDRALDVLERCRELVARPPTMRRDSRSGDRRLMAYEFETARLLRVALSHALTGVCASLEGAALAVAEIERLCEEPAS